MSVTAPVLVEDSARCAFWGAPLAGVAVALTAGMLVDRFWQLPFLVSISAGFLCLMAWGGRNGLVLILAAAFCLGAARDSLSLHMQPAESLSRWPGLDDQPVRLQGRVASEARRRAPPAPSPLRREGTRTQAVFLLQCRRVILTTGVEPARGSVQVWVADPGALPALGDMIEVVGMLRFPNAGANPGGVDRAAQMRDQGLAASLDAEGDCWHLVEKGGWRLDALLGWLRREARRRIDAFIPTESGLAAALLIGDDSGMTQDDWEVYFRTGVVHALAISGQHLMVLAGFVIWLVRLGHVPQRRAAPAVAVVLFLYALVSGGRPPVMRAAYMMLAFTLASWQRRPIHHANVFALAWIICAIADPGSLFSTGCLLSFLAVGVLIWGLPAAAPEDPVQRLLAERRPWLANAARNAAHAIGLLYLVNFLVWIAITPLLALRGNLATPVALLIGPPTVLLTTVALLFGFVALIAGTFVAPLGFALGAAAGVALTACRSLAAWADRLPWAKFYLADPGLAWIIPFYVGLILALTTPLLRKRQRLVWGAAVVWIVLGGLAQFLPRASTDFRCTFLAVGHGGCVVLETPDGGVLLYDAGAMTGPEVTQQHIAPYLWQRGIRRIDHVLISHADLDHFNGLPALLERFAVARVSLTPSFSARPTQAVSLTLEALKRHGLTAEILKAGEAWQQDEAAFEVLHPPENGPEGVENARSLVLFVDYKGLRILLTGDLQDAGLPALLAQRPRPVDVLMAPHHGSAAANTRELAAWAKPRLVVSSQGRPRGAALSVYGPAPFASTWDHGAVTVRSEEGLAWAETFRTRRTWALR